MASSLLRTTRRIGPLLLMGWILGKMAGCMLLVPGPWGPVVEGGLPSGDRVAFRSRCLGRETDDQLVWTDRTGRRHKFWVDQIHGGFAAVTLKAKEDGLGVWVEADGKVGASLDLATGEFHPERDLQFPWAVYGTGTTLAKGRTWGVLQMLYPL